MDERQKSRARDWCKQGSLDAAWSLSRVDVISSLKPPRWPVGQVELFDKKGGRALEIATGAGGMDAIFNALAQHFGVEASVKALSVEYQPGCEALSKHPVVEARVEVGIEGRSYSGFARTGDLLLSTAAAYLNALSSASEGRPAISFEVLQ